MSTSIVVQYFLYPSMGPRKYCLFSATFNRVVGRPHGDMYHTINTYFEVYNKVRHRLLRTNSSRIGIFVDFWSSSARK